MSNTFSSKLGAGARLFLAALLAGVLLAEMAGWAYTRIERHAHEQSFCASKGLDASDCARLMDANRRSWGE
ncbi:hypothetical protein [Paraburkholderia fungorum]|nr:hypothetical protein [Paraburkholderia fungorum]MBB5547457.1 hypothetical protein [Paraburkholderia fungorum]